MKPRSAVEHWLLDNLSDGVVLIDADWCIAHVNPAAAALLEADRDDLLGGRADPEHLALPERWFDALRASMADRELRALDRMERAAREGTRFFDGYVHPSPTGGIAVVVRDVTERKHDEEVLRLRDRALAANPTGVCLTDATQPDNPIIYVNPAFSAITGYAPEEVIGRNCRFLQRDDRDQPELEEIRQAVAEGRSCRVVLRNYRKDGTLFWNELSLAPVRDESGRLTHFVGSQQDVTAARRAQDDLVERNDQLKAARDQLAARNEELRQATQAKDRFMATISHEMRTPLNAILGYVELLNLGIAGDLSEMQRSHLQRISSSGRALLDLINDVIDFARAEAGKLSLELRPLTLEAVVEEAVELVRLQAEAKGLTLQVEAPRAPLPAVLGDFRRLRQILTNLLSNAVKFTRVGEVCVSFGASKGIVSVSVRDTGVGIPEQHLPHIFSEFFQGDSQLTREYGGAGLGLAISQRLARLMAGEIVVESTPDHGSTFTLNLKAATAAALDELPVEHRIAGAATGAVPFADGTPARVVVYGKDWQVLDALRQQLEPQVRVIGTTSASSVVDLARQESASLIVLDVACHGGMGWEAAHDIREESNLDDVAVLLLPCLPDPAGTGTTGALDLGWVAVVPKPFTSDQLTHMVERAIGRSVESEDEETQALDVLVVDDDPDAREIAAKILGAAGAQVRTAADGEEALVEMRHTPPDVVVVDLMMPVLDGFGVVATMRADPALQDIPVVVLTAKDLSEAERRFLSRTAETILQKGVHSLSDIATLILRAAQRRAG